MRRPSRKFQRESARKNYSTSKLLWTFHTVPQAGEPGVETWLKDSQTGEDSWKFTGNTGAWGPLTGDEELGYVYIPVEAPSGDTSGGQRPGANLYSDSIVCLDAKNRQAHLALPAYSPRDVGLRHSRRAHPA
jgi:glucose dehydrogenase